MTCWLTWFSIINESLINVSQINYCQGMFCKVREMSGIFLCSKVTHCSPKMHLHAHFGPYIKKLPWNLVHLDLMQGNMKTWITRLPHENLRIHWWNTVEVSQFVQHSSGKNLFFNRVWPQIKKIFKKFVLELLRFVIYIGWAGMPWGSSKFNNVIIISTISDNLWQSPLWLSQWHSSTVIPK